jgi:hypothetical protein
MNGKISVEGFLVIERAGECKTQCCMHRQRYFDTSEYSKHEVACCGDWCPQFGEPFCFEHESKYRLLICDGRTIKFDRFEDQREYRLGKRLGN